MTTEAASELADLKLQIKSALLQIGFLSRKTEAIYRSHLLKGVSRTLYWAQPTKIGRWLPPASITILDGITRWYMDNKGSVRSEAEECSQQLFSGWEGSWSYLPGSEENLILDHIKNQFHVKTPFYISSLTSNDFPLDIKTSFSPMSVFEMSPLTHLLILTSQYPEIVKLRNEAAHTVTANELAEWL